MPECDERRQALPESQMPCRTAMLSSTTLHHSRLTRRIAARLARASGAAFTAAKMRSNISVYSPPASGEPQAEGAARAAARADFLAILSLSYRTLLQRRGLRGC